MAGGDQAGSAYVPIRPDMRGFHTEIERELRRTLGPIIGRIAQQMGREFGSGFGRGSENSDPFEPFEQEQQRQRRRQRREGQEQGGAFAQSFSRALSRASDQLPRLEIDADSSEADRTLAELRGRMERLAASRVGVDVSAEDAQEELDEIREALAQVQDGADVQVRMDVGASLAQLDRFREQIDRLDGDDVEVHIDVDGDDAESSIGRLSRAGGILSSALRGVGSAVGLVRFAPMAVGGAAAAGAMVQVTSALGPLVGLAAAAPAAFIGMKVAAGVLQLAMYGVQDAFGAALTADAEAFQESLEGLSPAARATAVELRGLRPQLMGVQQAAQQAFFGPLVGQLRRTAGVLVGPVRSGVKGVATEFGLAARSVAGFARQSATVRAVRAIFAGVRQSVAALRPALVPVAAGIRDIAAAGSGSLPQMATSVAALAERFGGWLSQISASGQVQEWISGALAAAQQLGAVLADVGGIITSIFQSMSAAGSGTLGPLGTLLDQLNAFLNSAEGSAALTSFFSGLSSITTALAPLVPLLGSVVAELVAGLLPIVQALTPVLSVLVDSIGMVVRALLPLLPPLGQTIASLVSGLAPILTPIIQLLAETASTILGALVQALVQCLPALQSIVMAVGELLPLLTPLVPLWADLLLAIVPLIPLVVNLVAMLVGYLVPVLRLVITVAVAIVSTVLSKLAPVLRFLVGVITWVAGLVQPLLTLIGRAFQWLGQAALWLWREAIQPAFRFIAQLGKWLYQVLAVIVIAPLLIAFKILSTVVTWLYKSIFRPIFRAIGAVVQWVWETLIQPVLRAFQSVLRNVVAPVVRWLYNSVIRPVWQALGSAIRWVWENVIRKVFDAIRSQVSRLAGYFRTAVSAIAKAWDKLKSAARKPVKYVVDVVYNKGIVRIWNAVADLVPGVSSLDPVKFARGGVVPGGAYGVLPGYAPGRDTMLAAVSPGEAWIRPDATRALGSDFVYGLNSAAVSGGTAGAARFLAEAGGPRFGLGGIVGGFLKSAKDFFSDGLVTTATRAFNPMLNLADRAIGGTAFGDMAVGAARGLVGKILSFFKPLEDQFGGGRRVVKVAEKYVGVSGNPNQWTRRMGMDGLPWCGMFVDGVFDEAGAARALAGVANPASVWSYRSLPAVSPSSKRPGDLALYRGDAGHINIYTGKGVTTIGGNESNSVRRQSGYINSASSIRRPRFALGGVVPDILAQDRRNNTRHTTPLATQMLRTIAGQPTHDDGGWVPPGLNLVANYTRRPEAVLTERQYAALASAARVGNVGGNTYIVHPREHTLTEAGLERMTRRQDALARIGRPT